jgi:ankyrin repeat protein
MAAAYFGHAEMIKLLVDAGATVDLAGDNGRTALMIAKNLNHDIAVKTLVRNGAGPKRKGDEGWAAEGIVAYKELAVTRAAKVKAMRKRLQAFPKKVPNPQALVSRSDLECTDFVTDLIVHERQESLGSFLFELISNGRDMKAILNSPAEFWCDDPCHYHRHPDCEISPLGHAMEIGDPFVVELLMGAGADINKLAYAKDPDLHIASGAGNPYLILVLIAIGAKVNQAGSEFGGTALMADLETNQIRAMQMLSEAGAKINQLDKIGNSALHHAVLLGNSRAVEFLILKGANLNQTGAGGYTPLMYAAKYGRQSIAEALIKAGAKINMQAGFLGKTSLMLASERGSLFTVKLLLDHGAKTNVKEKGKYTALDRAIQNNHREIADLLADHGARSKKQ